MAYLIIELIKLITGVAKVMESVYGLLLNP